MAPRFVRVCPTHRLILEEESRSLRCPLSLHQVTAWLVVDLETRRILGAGRTERVGGRSGTAGAVFLGSRLQLGADVLLDRGDRRVALPVPAHPAGA